MYIFQSLDFTSLSVFCYYFMLCLLYIQGPDPRMMLGGGSPGGRMPGPPGPMMPGVFSPRIPPPMPVAMVSS